MRARISVAVSHVTGAGLVAAASGGVSAATKNTANTEQIFFMGRRERTMGPNLGQVSEATWTFARAGESRNVLEQHEVVAVNDFEALAGRVEGAQGDGLEAGECGDFLAREIGFAAGEHGGVGAGDVDDVTDAEFPAGVRDADGEEAAAAFAEHGDGAGVHEYRAGGALEIGEPMFFGVEG